VLREPKAFPAHVKIHEREVKRGGKRDKFFDSFRVVAIVEIVVVVVLAEVV
jgi:hypothetical protein